jgi:hypothetical protein
MAQEFCTLEQAAQMLNMSPQELNAMIQRREIRAFSDRGTWRLRVQDVQELARRRGIPSSEEIRLPPPKSGRISKSGRLPKPASAEAPIPLTPAMEEQPLEAEIVLSPGDEIHLTPQEDVQVAMPAETVDIFASDEPSTKKSGSKSEIILVPKEGELELLAVEDEGPASSSFVFPTGKKPKTAAPTKVEKEVPDDGGFAIGGDEPPTTVGDSQVRLDSLSGRLPDSGVRLVDFDLPSQLSGLMPPPPSSRKIPKPPSTVDLLRPGAVPPGAPGSGTKMAPSSGKQPLPPLPAAPAASSSKMAPPPKSGKVTSESKKSLTEAPGFDPAAAANLANLSPTDSGSESALKPDLSLSDFELEVSRNEPGDSVFDLTMSKPSVPSLELELTSDLDVGTDEGDTDVVDISGGPRQKPASGGTMRGKIEEQLEAAESGTFELSMDSDEFSTALGDQADSSDFELALESSSSESLDLAEEGGEVESTGSIEVRPDEMETSDFELALDEDSSSEVLDETTDSEVVVIEEEEGVPAAERAGVPIEDEDLVVEEAAEEEAPAVSEAALAAAAAPAEWGYWSLTLVPTVLVMPLVGFLLFEMIRSAASYHQPSVVAGPIYSIVRDMTK